MSARACPSVRNDVAKNNDVRNNECGGTSNRTTPGRHSLVLTPLVAMWFPAEACVSVCISVVMQKHVCRVV